MNRVRDWRHRDQEISSITQLSTDDRSSQLSEEYVYCELHRRVHIGTRSCVQPEFQRGSAVSRFNYEVDSDVGGSHPTFVPVLPPTPNSSIGEHIAPPSIRRRNHISTVVKSLLFFFNFIFWLAGMTVSGLGVWILLQKDKKIRDALDVFFDPSILMCIAGCVIWIIGFFGCFGAARENKCLLKAFNGILVVLVILELILGAVLLLLHYVPGFRQQLGFLNIENTMNEAIIRYRDDGDLRDMIDVIQSEFKCCGMSDNTRGYLDWRQNLYFNCSPSNVGVERCGVPFSCCKNQKRELRNIMCGFGVSSLNFYNATQIIHTQGCLRSFGSWIQRNSMILAYGAICIIVPEFIGLYLSTKLINQIRKQQLLMD